MTLTVEDVLGQIPGITDTERLQGAIETIDQAPFSQEEKDTIAESIRNRLKELVLPRETPEESDHSEPDQEEESDSPINPDITITDPDPEVEQIQEDLEKVKIEEQTPKPPSKQLSRLGTPLPYPFGSNLYRTT